MDSFTWKRELKSVCTWENGPILMSNEHLEEMKDIARQKSKWLLAWKQLLAG